MKKLVLLLMLGFALPALADIQTFEGLGLPFINSSPITFGNATYSSDGDGVLRYYAFGVGGSYGLGTDEDTNTLTISFSSASNGASLDIGYSDFTVNFLDSSNNVLCTASVNQGYGQFTNEACGGSVSSITVHDLDNNGLIVIIDNVESNSTPEPGSLFLLGSGLMGLGGMVRRKLIA